MTGNMPEATITLTDENVHQLLEGKPVPVEIGTFVGRVNIQLGDQSEIQDVENVQAEAHEVYHELLSIMPAEIVEYGNHVVISACGSVVFSTLENLFKGKQPRDGLSVASCKAKAAFVISEVQKAL